MKISGQDQAPPQPVKQRHPSPPVKQREQVQKVQEKQPEPRKTEGSVGRNLDVQA
jgi:hypothetical protein